MLGLDIFSREELLAYPKRKRERIMVLE